VHSPAIGGRATVVIGSHSTSLGLSQGLERSGSRQQGSGCSLPAAVIESPSYWLILARMSGARHTAWAWSWRASLAAGLARGRRARGRRPPRARQRRGARAPWSSPPRSRPPARRAASRRPQAGPIAATATTRRSRCRRVATQQARLRQLLSRKGPGKQPIGLFFRPHAVLPVKNHGVGGSIPLSLSPGTPWPKSMWGLKGVIPITARTAG
jgi:hypothetical protein